MFLVMCAQESVQTAVKRMGIWECRNIIRNGLIPRNIVINIRVCLDTPNYAATEQKSIRNKQTLKSHHLDAPKPHGCSGSEEDVMCELKEDARYNTVRRSIKLGIKPV